MFNNFISGQVSAEINPKKVKPGENVRLTIHADSDSTVYLLAEDERNRIIGTDNDIFSSVVRS